MEENLTKKDVEKMIRDGISSYMKSAQFNETRIPRHNHDGIDTSKIPTSSIKESVPFIGTKGGVSNLEVLGTQIINNEWEGKFKNPQTLHQLPIPIIYGGGNITTINFTGALSAGATSAILSSAWSDPSIKSAVVFDNNQLANVTFTNGSTAVSWTNPLKFGSGASADLVGDAIFKGGEAKNGSCLIFSGFGDLYPYIFFKVERDGFTDSWWGLQLDVVPPTFFNL